MKIFKFVKNIIFLLFTCLAVFDNAVAAKDWFKLNINDKDKQWYINIKSIIQNGKYTNYWCKIIYLHPKGLPKKNISYIKIRFLSDCYRNLISVTELVGYSKNNKILFRESSKNLNTLNPVIPNSIYQSVQDSVCKYALFQSNIN